MPVEFNRLILLYLISLCNTGAERREGECHSWRSMVRQLLEPVGENFGERWRVNRLGRQLDMNGRSPYWSGLRPVSRGDGYFNGYPLSLSWPRGE